METEILARLQFALTIMFHYIYPPLSIGISLLLVIMEGIYLKTKNPLYLEMAKFWTKIFALTFAIGVATGIVMEFEFGTNWATYSRYVGDVFGSALAAEGVFAFFLESGFLALLLFGWDKVGPKVHFFATLMVCLGAHFSAIWIVVANSWMQTPAGFHIVGEGITARAEITDFWGMVFNPSSMVRLAHTVIGAWLAGAFLVMSVSAFYILRKKHIEFATRSIKIALSVACVSLILQLYTGHLSGKVVAQYQPAKLAAFEGIFETTRGARLSIVGLPNTKEKRVDYEIGIPRLLSYLVYDDFNAEIKGLDQYPARDWPNVSVVFQTYHLMIAMWGLMALISLWTLVKWRRGALADSRVLLYALMCSVLFPQIGGQAGWTSAEMGRYPWIVQGYLRISDGLSKSVTASQIFGSLVLFTILYLFLFILFLYLLHEKIKGGPKQAVSVAPTYHHLQEAVEEIKHDIVE